MLSSNSPSPRKTPHAAASPPEPDEPRFEADAQAVRRSGAAAPSKSSTVNYDSAAIVEVAIAGIDYRLDSGKQGTLLSISTRESGTWDWAFGGEARWDGSSLRARAFERRVLQELSTAFAHALANIE